MANRSDSEPSAIAVKIAETLLADKLGPPKVNADAAGREALVGNYYSPKLRRVLTIREHARSEEHTSELQSLMRISYAVFCLKKKKKKQNVNTRPNDHTILQT